MFGQRTKKKKKIGSIKVIKIRNKIIIEIMLIN